MQKLLIDETVECGTAVVVSEIAEGAVGEKSFVA
jgi:hypothetical protein